MKWVHFQALGAAWEAGWGVRGTKGLAACGALQPPPPPAPAGDVSSPLGVRETPPQALGQGYKYTTSSLRPQAPSPPWL